MRIRATLLLLAVVVSAAACSPVADLKPYTAAQIEAMEVANAEVVYAAAAGCELSGDVYPVGTHAWDFAEHFAEAVDDHPLMDAERCMESNLAVAQAAAAMGLLDAVELQPYGEYGYKPAFVASKTDGEMVAIDRGLQEAITRRMADRFH